MKHYTIEELIKLWALESLTPEQAIGQLILHLQAVYAELTEAKQAIKALKAGKKPEQSQ
jgi:hypothetical protein